MSEVKVGPYCFICEKRGHRASQCPQRPGQRILAALVALGLMALPALGHGWYDTDCCHDNDCAPITKEAWPQGRDGDSIITTKQGEGRTGPGTRIRPSKDEKDHACIMHGRVMCVYRAAGA